MRHNKTANEVAQRFGLEYCPKKVSFKKKVNLRDLTPTLTAFDKKFQEDVMIIVGVVFLIMTALFVGALLIISFLK